MKRLLYIVLFILIMVFASGIAYANSGLPDVDIKVDGQAFKAPQVNIKLDNKTLISEVPPVIIPKHNRTMVPVRFYFEMLGAKVDWDNDTQVATITHNSNVINLKINSDIVAINGKDLKVEEEYIPKLITYTSLNDSRTMAPIRFFSQILGYDVDWDPSSYTALIDSPKAVEPEQPQGTATITGISAIKGSTGKHRIRIDSDKPLKFESMYLSDSNKLVLDFKDTRVNIPGKIDAPGDIRPDDALIKRIQYSQFTIPPNPYTARVVLTLEKEADFSFVSSEDGKISYIAFDDNVVTGIYSEKKGGKEHILVEGVTFPEINIIELKNPTRIVIDIMDATLSGEQYQTFDYKLGFVKSVRASQFVADNNYSSDDRIVRVVLDVKDGIDNAKALIVPTDEGLLIYPEEDIWDAFSYDNLGKQSLLKFVHLDEVKAELNYDEVKKELLIEIPTRDTELSEGSFVIKDNLVDKITVERGRRTTEITVSFRRSVSIEVLSDRVSDTLEFLAIRNEDIVPGERTIVVDAGHGGKDPGAISINGYKEKDINLSMALQLEDLLLEEGYNVIMTRTTDEFIELYERPRIANSINADLFISMHSNSNLKSEIIGLEVLYCPSTSSEIKMEDQYPFAETIYNNIINNTNNPGRGVIKRPELVVLRETIMPAVLVEIGYLSNVFDEQLVMDLEYQSQIIRGIVDGVDEYFLYY